MSSPESTADAQRERIDALILTIREAEAELQALTGGELDAVITGSGQAYLLQDAQDRLIASLDAEQEVALTQRAILDALPAHLALVDSNGVVRTVNAAWRAFGEANAAADPNYGIGRNYLEVAEHAAGLGADGAAEVATGLRTVLAGELSSFVFEYPCHAPHEDRWFRVMITPVRDAQVRGAVVMHLDITERRVSERALHASTELLRESLVLQEIAQRMGRIGGWSVLAPAATVQWSDQVCAIHGVPSGTVPTVEQALDYYVPEHRETISAAFLASMRDGTAFDLELQLITAQKERRWVRAIGQAQYNDDGTLRAVQGALQDISEQKRLEQQFLRAQRMESVGTLAGGIAHDLNNVLTPILMSIELLRISNDDKDRFDLLDGIEAAARRGADMVRQVLTFARGADGKRVHVQLRHLVREIEKIVRETFPRNISVRTEVPSELSVVVGDPTQLHQVLINLCVNARDAMPNGGHLAITVSEAVLDEQYVGMSVGATPGSHVVVQIEDTGTGMSARVLDRIFEPFFTTKDLGKGTGLGLSTSAAIIKSHGGFIRAYSEPGKGSRFRVYLPAIAGQHVAEETEFVTSVPRGKGELILVVDDESAVREITKQSLETFGYRVVTATDGAEGVAVFALHRQEIKLVLTDMMMPVMDGASLIEVVLRMDPQARIIAASGLHTHGAVLRTSPSRVREFLSKPYTAETLLTTIRRVLDA